MNRKVSMTPIVITLCFILLIFPVSIAKGSTINILINGNLVPFSDETGYPYIDENNRTMVPLRITMETAGFSVGYDTNTRTAIVITEYNRIEIPIGTNKIYTNNNLSENDTVAVIKDSRTYLPIRAVLQNADFTVEWASEVNTVNAYNFDYNANEFVPYSTSSPSTLLSNLLNGNVIYYEGQYYATPAYVKSLSGARVQYLGDDLNTAIYPQANRYDLANLDASQIEWVSGVNFDYLLVSNSQLEKFGVSGKLSEIPNYSYAYVFYEQIDKIKYCVDEMTDDFFNATDATGTFNDIRMKKEAGTLYFFYADLYAKNIYKLQ